MANAPWQDVDFDGAVILITGAASGLGRETAGLLATLGADVVLADVNADRAEGTAAALREDGYRATTLHLDVSDPDACDRAVADLFADRGRLDALINAAGVDVTAPAIDISTQDWRRIMGVNLDGPFWLSRAVLPVMREQGGGHIVNIASTAAKRAWANAAAYHASKWGLLGLSHALHVEGREYGVKVTAIVAGGMRTPFVFDRFPDLDPGLLQDPACVAQTILFALCQPRETVIPELTVLPMRETSWP
ncbi:MAG: SDR family oxidoreductase [Dehalococcoidia bacterium]|nr:SDR family oxidoreductase [Dehalococcoidia bacterium]